MPPTHQDPSCGLGRRDPPRPTIVVETVDEDGSSGTGEEFSLASEDDFASKEEEDDDEEDPTAAPPPGTSASRRMSGSCTGARRRAQQGRRGWSQPAGHQGGQGRSQPASHQGRRWWTTHGTPQKRRGRRGPGSPCSLWSRRGHEGPGRRGIGERGRQGPRQARPWSGHHHEDPPQGPCRRGGAEPSSVAGVVWRPSVAAPTGEKTQGRERGGSAADFSQAPKRRRSCLARRETEPPRRPTARPMPAGGRGAPKGRVRRRCPQGRRQGNGLRRDARARDNVGPTHGRQRSGSGCVDGDAKEEDGASPR